MNEATETEVERRESTEAAVPARSSSGQAPAPMDFGQVLNRFATDEALEQQNQLMEAYDRACRSILTENDIQEESGREFKKKSAWRKLARTFGISTEIVRGPTGQWSTEEDEYNPHTGEQGVRHYEAECVVRATAPWGQTMDGTGACDTRETRFYTTGPLCPRCGGPMWDNREKDWQDAPDFRCKKKDSCGGEYWPDDYDDPDEIAAGRRVPNPTARAKAVHDCKATAETRAKNRAISDLIAMGEVTWEEMQQGGETPPREARDSTPRQETDGNGNQMTDNQKRNLWKNRLFSVLSAWIADADTMREVVDTYAAMEPDRFPADRDSFAWSDWKRMTEDFQEREQDLLREIYDELDDEIDYAESTGDDA